MPTDCSFSGFSLEAEARSLSAIFGGTETQPREPPDSFWLGIESRGFPDANGWTSFDVFPWQGSFYWSACDDDGDHVGFREGPFPTAKAAYFNAVDGG